MLFKTRLRLSTALVVLLLVGGCAGGYRSSTRDGHEKVYKVDDEGNKNLVYEVAPDGTLTVHDETDSRAQEMIKAQEHQEHLKALEAERIALIQAAPKRAANNPIRVLLHDLDVSEDLLQAQHTEGAIEEQYRQAFEGDRIIHLVGPTASKANEITQIAQALKMLSGEAPTQAPSAAPASDVEVVTRAYVEEKVGVNKRTNKLGSYAALVYEATIRSNYLPAEYTVTEQGNVFRNAEVTKRLAERIKSVIENQIGPTIPADRKL